MHPNRYTIALVIFLCAALGGCQQHTATAATTTPNGSSSDRPVTLVQPDGSYPTKSLAKDEIVLKVVQNGVKNLQDYDDPRSGLTANLQIMLNFLGRACREGDKPDIVLFNEFPLTGYSTGSRDEKLRLTLQIPGPETQALGKAAAECDTYLVFGSYANDADWPGHILSINTIIDRNGDVAAKYWKPRNVIRLTPGAEIPTTTIENVRDRYRSLYGIEAEFPVLQTEFGNIAVSTVQLDPFVYAAYAMRGVEIMLRTATLFSKEDVLAIARFNNFYSAMSNITFPPGSGIEQHGGGSLIVSPTAQVLAEAPGNDERIITASIPIAAFRNDRRIPRYPLEVVAPVFEQYQQEIPLNHLDLPAAELPQTREQMSELLDRQSRYLNAR